MMMMMLRTTTIHPSFFTTTTTTTTTTNTNTSKTMAVIVVVDAFVPDISKQHHHHHHHHHDTVGTSPPKIHRSIQIYKQHSITTTTTTTSKWMIMLNPSKSNRHRGGGGRSYIQILAAGREEEGEKGKAVEASNSLISSLISPQLSKLPPPPPHPQQQTKNVGLYIHIPYCRKRCYYCNFAIIPIGNHQNRHQNRSHSNNNSSNISITTRNNQKDDGFYKMNDLYVNTMIQELQFIQQQHNTNNNEKIILQSIYFGGGTPSLLPISSLRQILHTIQRKESMFTILKHNNNNNNSNTNGASNNNSNIEQHDDCEITMEVDPGTFTLEMVQEWKLLGINRFSLGVQSMDDTILQYLGRTHTVHDIYHSIYLLSFVYGNDNLHYSIDLISGVPGLTICKWIETLDIVTNTLEPPPKHISIYDLQVESNTIFGQRYNNNNNDDDDSDGRNIDYDIDDRDDNDDKSATVPSTNNNNVSSYQKGTMNIIIPNIISNNKSSTSNDDSSNNNNHHHHIIPPLPSLQDTAFMYKYASGYLRSKSYEHYEISSYAAYKSPPSSQHSSTRTTSVENGVNIENDNDNHHHGSISSSSSTAPAVKSGMLSYRSRHNQIYWGYHNVSAWYAIGLGATSFDLQQQIVKRPNAMSDYIQWVNNQQQVLNNDESKRATMHQNVIANHTRNDDDMITRNDSIQEEVMDIILKRLRTIDGLSLRYIQEYYGIEFVNAILKGIQPILDNDKDNQLIALTGTAFNNNNDNTDNTKMEHCYKEEEEEDWIIQLVDPMGFLYSNTIISNIFYELFELNK